MRYLPFALLLLGCGGGDGSGGPDELDVSGVWSFSGEGQSEDLPGTCTLTGVLSLTQSGSTASGSFDGPLDCTMPGLPSFNEDIDAPVEGFIVHDNTISWDRQNCELNGEAQDEDHFTGDIVCQTNYLNIPVTVEGTWEMNR